MCGLAGTITTLGAFTGGQNGIWSLVIMDDHGSDSGTMLNWSITFAASPTASASPPALVPTLSEWGMVILPTLMGLFGLIHIGRRRHGLRRR